MPTSSRTRSLRPILPRSELSILNTPTQIVRPPLPTPESSAVTSASVASPIQVSPSGGSYFFHWRGRKLRMMGPLPWPCDSLELERVEAQHWLLRLLLGFPYIGPVEEVLRAASRDGRQGQVLDIATGVGVWAMDVAELFPSVQVTGCDDVPIQEVETWANVEWDVVDLDDLPYDAESFDVVHIRFAQLRVKSFRHLLRSAWRILRPGGVLLVFDAASPPTRSDTTSPTGCQAWSDAFHKSLHRAGLKPFTVDDIVRVFRDEELIGSDMRVPIGYGEGRMGQLGKIHVVNTRAYLDAGRYVLTEHGGYTDAEVDVLTDAYLADIKNWQLYTRYHAFSVRKGSAHA